MDTGGRSHPGSRLFLRAAGMVSFLLLASVPAILFLAAPDRLARPLSWFSLVLAVGAVGGFLLPAEQSPRFERVVFSTLLTTTLLWSSSYIQHIRAFPFSLTWSEGNHLWQASLFFRESTGIPAADVVFSNYVTPGLYGLRGLPFGFGCRSMLVLRAWEAFLWLAPPLLFLWVIVQRWTTLRGLRGAVLVLWGGLFIAQGPVYAPLLLGGAVAVEAAADRRHWVQRLGMLLGSLIAGMGRWTWMFTPGLWALFLLRFRTRKDDVQALAWKELAWDLASLVVGGLISQGLTLLLTGHMPFTYLATLAHPLLWYRLFPNETYEPGILKSLLLTAGPLLLVMGYAWARGRHACNRWMTGFSLLAMTGLLAAGLVISVKIGGGSNLHNLDMFLVSLIVLTAMLFQHDAQRPEQKTAAVVYDFAMMVVLLLPAWHIISGMSPLTLPEPALVQEASATLDAVLADTAGDETVLLIDQRHRLALDDYPALRWEPAYEQVEMMDHALAADETYFEAFREDVQGQRYRWIICDPQPIVFKGRTGPFGEENDAWVTYVSIPLMDSYEIAYAFDDVGIWILSPRTEDLP